MVIASSTSCCIFIQNFINGSEPPGKQHTNLWVACGSPGSLPISIIMRTVSTFLRHDDFEQAYVQRCHHKLNAQNGYFVVRQPSRARTRVVSLTSKVSLSSFANL